MSQHEPTAANADAERLGRNLEALRKSRGLSQTQLAKLMVDAGQTHFRQTTVSRLERGTQPLRVSDMNALQEIFGVDASKIWADTANRKRWIDAMIMNDSGELIAEKIAMIARDLSKTAQELDELRELFAIFTDAIARNIGEGEDGQHQEEA